MNRKAIVDYELTLINEEGEFTKTVRCEYEWDTYNSRREEIDLGIIEIEMLGIKDFYGEDTMLLEFSVERI